MASDVVLEVRNLVTHFSGAFREVRAVDDLSFTVARGETVAIVGESGSGKSVTASSIINMVAPPGRILSGEILFKGEEVLHASERRMRQIRGAGIGMIFQDPMASLDPLMKIRDQIEEAMRAHGKFSGRDAQQRAVDLMTMVGIADPEARLADYPHNFSGGMRQRVMIAIAAANEPDLIIADEPTTALDVTIQAQILDLLAQLNSALGTAVLLITHNLGVVAQLCHRAVVMYGGKVMEEAPVDELFARPAHPYTRALLSATPRLSAPRSWRLQAIDGRPPVLTGSARGCVFASRCALAEGRCHSEVPPLRSSATHRWACWVADPEGGFPPGKSQSGGVSVAEADRTVTSAGAEDAPLLELQSLTKQFAGGRGRRRRTVTAVHEVSLSVSRGETVGLVGESGCGKSTLGKLVLGVYPPTEGVIRFDGRPVADLGSDGLRWYRRQVQLVFQDPYSSLNPRLTVGDALAEPLRIHGLVPGRSVRGRVDELLALVGLDASAAERFPHEFSGGQRQRVAIARALAVEPRLIVCDEAVSALDVSLQAQIVNLLVDLQDRFEIAYLFISHDLATVRHISNRIIVMYLGQVVEVGPSDAVSGSPKHPYTASLLSAVPEPDPETERTRERVVLSGDIPSPMNPPSGCPFHTRCPVGPAVNADRVICTNQRPLLQEVGDGHATACHFPGELERLADILRTDSSTDRVLGPPA